MQAYRNTYKHFLVPFSTKDLPSTLGILPLVYKRQRGRPKTKRIRKGAWKRKTTRCGNCHGTGHNSQSCRHAPATNIRRERARDRESSITSKSETESNSSQEDQESLNSDDLQDIQFQAELERYDAIIARAWEIENRRRQEELEDNELIGHDISGYSESDSELSMLGSSQFEGMEGIELGSDIELGSGIELGGGIELGSGIELGGGGGGDALGDVSGDSEVKVSRFGRVLKQSRR